MQKVACHDDDGDFQGAVADLLQRQLGAEGLPGAHFRHVQIGAAEMVVGQGVVLEEPEDQTMEACKGGTTLSFTFNSRTTAACEGRGRSKDSSQVG